MMRFIYVAMAALSLLSGGQPAPVTDCETLTRTMEIQGREQLLGRWAHAAESTNIKGFKLLTAKVVETVWANITAADETDAINKLIYQKMLGRCFSLTMKMTLANSTLSMANPAIASEVLLNTSCPDCLVFFSKYSMGENTYSDLQLLSRRNKVTTAELQEFIKQAACLNLPPPVILNPEKGFCPDPSSSPETETTDLTNMMNEQGVEILDMFDKMINNEGGMEMLTQMLSMQLSALDVDQ